MSTGKSAEIAPRDYLEHASGFIRDATDATNALGAIKEVENSILMLRSATQGLVAEARANGGSWAQIGAALGMSRQAAHERFAPLE